MTTPHSLTATAHAASAEPTGQARSIPDLTRRAALKTALLGAGAAALGAAGPGITAAEGGADSRSQSGKKYAMKKSNALFIFSIAKRKIIRC